MTDPIERLKRARERYRASEASHANGLEDSQDDFARSRGWTGQGMGVGRWRKGSEFAFSSFNACVIEEIIDLTELIAAVDEVVDESTNG